MAEIEISKLKHNTTTYSIVPHQLRDKTNTHHASLPTLSTDVTLLTSDDLTNGAILPTGGNTGDVLTKGAGQKTEWKAPTGGGGGGAMTKEQILQVLGITDADLQMAMKIAAATQSVSGNNVIMKGQFDAASFNVK